MPINRETINLGVAELRNSSNEFFFNSRRLKYPNASIGIAEGDSWFDYLPAWFEDAEKGDLINQLNKYEVDNERQFNILRIAEAGDTLENMVFGNDLDKLGEPAKNQFLKTLVLVKRYRPKFVLFSGGGNDVVGEGLISFLNHAELESEFGLLREEYIDYTFNNIFRGILEAFISKILEIDGQVKIILHGYGYAIPDGRPVVGDQSYGFIGPWMAPAFAKKRISFQEGQKIIKLLIDKFNELLQDISDSSQQVHFLDLRNIIQNEDWANELHLTVTGYEKVAQAYADKLLKIL